MSQGKFEDLTGIQFGKLTVIQRAPDYIQPSGQHKRMWHCLCECGNECDVRASDLKSGNTKSCGCFQQFSRGKSTFDDLTGRVFGKLTVISRLPDHITPSGQRKRMWNCLCKCGNNCAVYGTQLRDGRKSCGCIEKEKRDQKAKELEQKRLYKQQQLEKRDKEREQENKEREIIKKEKEQQRLILLQKRKAEIQADAKKKDAEKTDYLQKNNLAMLNPELLGEWDYERNNLDPQSVMANSTKVAWWKCKLGHPYEMRIYLRTRKQKCGCPYCSVPAKRVLKGFNDLKTKYPNIANEWHPTKNGELSPDAVLCGSARVVWWKGKCGHDFEQRIVTRVNGGNCPYCSHQKMLKGFNDFSTEHPELLSEWDYEKNSILPTEIMSHSHYKAWWKCPFGHSYQAWMDNRCKSNPSGCPICDKENHTSFSEQALFYYVKKCFPDAVNSDRSAVGMELDIYIPSLKIAIEYDGFIWHKSNKYELKKNRACKEKGILLMRIREEGLELYDDCYCLIRKDIKSEDSLSRVISQVLYDIDNIKHIEVDVKKDSAAIYGSYIITRKSQSLKAICPELSKEWHPTKNGNLTTEMVAPMSNKKVWWLGECGHEWLMSIQDRTNQKCGCPICAGKRIVSGINDLLTKYPALCEEWFYEKNDEIGLFPNKIAIHSDKKAWWKCSKCGYVWQSKVDSRTRMKSGCPECGRQTISAAKHKAVICLESGVRYISLKDAQEKTGISSHCISNCCKGIQKTAGKLHWRFCEK